MKFLFFIKFKLFFLASIIFSLFYLPQALAQDAHEPWEGAYSSGEFEGGVIREVYCDLVSLVEDTFGGLLFAAAGLMAFGFAAFGNGRYAYTAVIAGVGAFTMSAAVSLYFGDLGCGTGGGGQAQRTKQSDSSNQTFEKFLNEKSQDNGDISSFDSWYEDTNEHELF